MTHMRYTLQNLQADFPDDDACLEWILHWLYPDGTYCRKCERLRPCAKDNVRPRSYTCAYCGTHLHPTAGTIFHKSSTPLTKWFYAIYLMSATRAGISAKQLERELGVTYKCAHRMFHEIRKRMVDIEGPLTGEVELDEAYFHPNPERRSTAKPHHSQVVFGMVERGGRAKALHVKSSGVRVLQPEIVKHVATTATIYTDEHGSYRTLHRKGYEHKTINHTKQEYVTGPIHTQNVENLWSNMKRGITGVYRHVDAKYLQAYVNEYAFRYSHRNDYQPMFWTLLETVVSAPPAVESV